MQFETVLTNHLTEAFLIHQNKTLYDMSCTLNLTLFFHRVIKKSAKSFRVCFITLKRNKNNFISSLVHTVVFVYTKT